MIGQTLGAYRIEAQLGAGGMGVVYRAHDTRLGRTVALKLLPQHASVIDPAARSRLQAEAHALARLNHPNVCTVYEVGDVDGQTYIAMEHIQGRPLSDLISSEGIPSETVVQYGVQIAAGLAHAHEHGILHRDLKASNVMITDDGRAKVLDFGVARLVSDAQGEGPTRPADLVTAPGVLTGTPSYMAPELFRGEAADVRSDVWGLGVLLYHAAAGRLPFQGRGRDVGTAILHQPAAPLPSHVSAGLRSVIQRCLMKDPAQRYQRAIELRAALEVTRDALSGAAIARHDDSSGAPHRRRLLVAALALVAAAAVSGWIFWRSSGPREPTGTRLVSTFSGSHRSPSFSPDGRMIAFVSVAESGPSVPQIWVKNLARGEPVQITSGDVPALRPVWSPKGDQIVFARRGQGIWSVAPLGGDAQRIIEAGWSPNFSADGEWLVFERRRQVWIARSDGSQLKLVYTVPASSYSLDAFPALSPDGQSVVFFVAELGPNGDLWIVPTQGGEARRLTNDTREGGMPVFTPDGRDIIFSSTRRGSRILWRVPAAGGTPTPVTTGAGEDLDPALSRDGRSLIYVNVRNSWGLMLSDPTTGRATEIHSQRNGLKFPVFSPKADRIVFFAQDSRGDAHLFTIDPDGRNLRQVTHGEGQMNTMPFWSPDAESLFYYQMRPGFSLRRMAASGGETAEVAPFRWEVQQFARVDPTGKTMVYVRQLTPNVPDAVVLRDLQTGTETVFAEEKAHFHRPAWSRDGRRLLGWRHDGHLVVCSVADRRCSTLTKVETDQLAAWSGDDSRVFFLRPAGGPTRELWTITPDGRDERKLGEIGPFFPVDVFFDVSKRDTLVWVQYREGRQELWLTDLR